MAKQEQPVRTKEVDTKKEVVDNVKKADVKPRTRSWWKELILGLFNLIFVVMTFYYLSKLPEKAKLAKELRSASGVSTEVLDLELAKFDISTSEDKFTKLSMLFPDQKRLLEFISEIDKLKVDGNVTYFAFASESVVKEKSGFVGYPFVLEFEGSKQEVYSGLERFNNLPYLFRPVNFSIESGERPGSILLKYGGFLYVDDATQKN